MNPTGDECSMKGLASKKKELRQEMLRSRRQLPEIQRKSHSENIFSELTKHERLREFQFVHCFVGQSEEPDTLPILRWMLNQGKKVAVPCVDSDKVELQHSLILSTDVLEIGKFGILDVRPEKRIEVNISDLDLVLVQCLRLLANAHIRHRTHAICNGFDYNIMSLAEHPRS